MHTWYLFVELNGISQTLVYWSRRPITPPCANSRNLRIAISEASPTHSLNCIINCIIFVKVQHYNALHCKRLVTRVLVVVQHTSTYWYTTVFINTIINVLYFSVIFLYRSSTEHTTNLLSTGFIPSPSLKLARLQRAATRESACQQYANSGFVINEFATQHKHTAHKILLVFLGATVHSVPKGTEPVLKFEHVKQRNSVFNKILLKYISETI